VVKCRAGLGHGFNGDIKDAASLARGVFIVSAYWAGSGNVDGVSDANCAGEADDRLVG
jgi:hypothetical protein